MGSTRLSFAVIGACLIGALMMPVQAVVPAANNNLNNQIKEAGEDLDNANAKVAKAMKDYRKASAKLPAAEAALAKAKKVLAAAKSADAKAQGELQEVVKTSTKTENKLNKTKVTLSGQEAEVSMLIRSMYRQGPMSELAVVFGAETPDEFTTRLASVSSWHANKSALISSLAKNREDLTLQTQLLDVLEQKKAKKKQEAQVRVLTALEAAQEAAAAQKKVDKIVAEKAASYKIAMQHRDAVKKRYDALKKEQARQKKLAQQANNIGKDLKDNDNLLWPVSGARISGYTGWRVHPVYGYRSCHTGIDLAAPSGTPIKASEDGIVATVGNGGPYGRYTLISHGDGLTTFYAHQSSQKVREGERVTRGETIGLVGSTGWSTGAHLHYEVRKNGTPYNPMGWFGSSKSKVSCVD